MARPPRLNAEYFYHPADFRNDRRVKAIRAQLGAAGYGILVMLLEVLTDADHIQLVVDEMEIELLAGDLGVSAIEIRSVLQIAERVGLFGRTDAEVIGCPQLDEWLAPVFEKRNRAKNAALAGKQPQPVTETPITVTETQPVKNSTVQESIVPVKEKEEAPTSSFQSEVGAPPKPSIQPLPVKEKKEASHTRGARALAFDESPYASLDAVTAALAGTDYAHADLPYYHEVIRNWANGKGEKKQDWLSAIRGWILRDSKENKLKTTANTHHVNSYGNAQRNAYGPVSNHRNETFADVGATVDRYVASKYNQ